MSRKTRVRRGRPQAREASSGQGTAEYVLLLALVVLPMAFALRELPQVIIALYRSIIYGLVSPGL